MTFDISVKVVGFNDAHQQQSLNALLSAPEDDAVAYVLWSTSANGRPDVVLIDTDCSDAEQEIAATAAQAHQRVISVGGRPVPHAWRALTKPVNWSDLAYALASATTAQDDGSQDVTMHEPADSGFGPEPSACLLVGFSLENSFYLRARLALAGMYEVDQAEAAAQAHVKMKHRHYGMVVVDLSDNNIASWTLVQSMSEWSEPSPFVVVATSDRSGRMKKMTNQIGCNGFLEMPFAPHQVSTLLNKVAALTALVH